jgi:hypothetical protein
MKVAADTAWTLLTGLDLSEMGMEAYPADALGDAAAEAAQPAPVGTIEPTA